MSFLVNPQARLEIVIHKPVSNELLKSRTDDEILSEMKDIIESSYDYAPAGRR